MIHYPGARTYTLFVTLSFLFFFTIVAGQEEINLTGKVMDQDLTAIEDCNVELVDAGIADTTDGNGDFEISRTPASGKRDWERKLIHSIYKANGELIFSVENINRQVVIGIYSLKGRRIAGVLEKKLDTGLYRIFPRSFLPPEVEASIYLLRVQIGYAVRVYPMVYFSRSGSGGEGACRTIRGNETHNLAKVSAVIDTLVVTCDGHISQEIEIEEYMADLDTIVMARVLGSNASLASLEISDGDLSPVFHADTLVYSVSMYALGQITVTPTTEDSNASVLVNGESPDTPVALVQGANPVQVVVTAEDGVTERTYTVTVNIQCVATGEDVCDGLDNDCDSIVDNRFIAGGDLPYDGGPYADDAGKVKGQTCGTGLCAGGIVQCRADSSGLECSTEKNAIDELCDLAVDNDCDGEVDEGFPWGHACDGPDSDKCMNGAYTCTADKLGVECINESVNDIPEQCLNNNDDDCDEVVNEGCPCFYLNYTAGVCTTSTIDSVTGNCSQPADYADPESSDLPCDSLDNDCAGVTDENCSCQPSEWKCGTGCCEGTGCCGSNCQTRHTNNQTSDAGGRDPYWFDCVPWGTYNLTQALAACTRFTGDVAKCANYPNACDSDNNSVYETSVVCGDTDGNQDCACWAYEGPGAGYTWNPTDPSTKNECNCPVVGDPLWN